jgi:hypothetical protein
MLKCVIHRSSLTGVSDPIIQTYIAQKFKPSNELFQSQPTVVQFV